MGEIEKNRVYSTTLPLDQVRDWILQFIDPDHHMSWTDRAVMSCYINDKAESISITFTEKRDA